MISMFVFNFADLSAGYSPSILEAMRHAVLTSKVLKVQSSGDYEPLSYKDAFYLATLGGAEGKLPFTFNPLSFYVEIIVFSRP